MTSTPNRGREGAARFRAVHLFAPASPPSPALVVSEGFSHVR